MAPLCLEKIDLIKEKNKVSNKLLPQIDFVEQVVEIERCFGKSFALNFVQIPGKARAFLELLLVTLLGHSHILLFLLLSVKDFELPLLFVPGDPLSFQEFLHSGPLLDITHVLLGLLYFGVQDFGLESAME